MKLEFDRFFDAFLYKVTSFDFASMDEADFYAQVKHYLFAACSEFEKVFRSRTGLSFTDRDEEAGCFNWELPVLVTTGGMEDIISADEVVDIVSDGMVIRWLNSFLFSGDSLDLGNFLQTKDFQPYSPANFLSSLRGLHASTVDRYRMLINDFSFNHGELNTLHL